MCERSHSDHRLEILDLKNTMWLDCHFSKCQSLNSKPAELPMYSSAIEDS